MLSNYLLLSLVEERTTAVWHVKPTYGVAQHVHTVHDALVTRNRHQSPLPPIRVYPIDQVQFHIRNISITHGSGTIS